MVRSRAAFEVCKFADANAEATADGEDHRQLFTVDEISEDVVLGSRLHAAGFKGVFVPENLATGEVRFRQQHMPTNSAVLCNSPKLLMFLSSCIACTL